jgi:hypothetical protein
MKLAVLSLIAGSAAAFAPAQSGKVRNFYLVADVVLEIVIVSNF